MTTEPTGILMAALSPGVCPGSSWASGPAPRPRPVTPPFPIQGLASSCRRKALVAPRGTQAAGTHLAPLGGGLWGPTVRAVGRARARLPTLLAADSLTRSGSSCPRAPLPRAGTTCPGRGRVVAGTGTGTWPHSACRPHRRSGPPVGTSGSSLWADRPESQPDRLPGHPTPHGLAHSALESTGSHPQRHRERSGRAQPSQGAPAGPGQQHGPPSRPGVSCRHRPRGFRQVFMQGAPQGW